MSTLYVTESPNDDDLAKALGSMALRIPIPHGDVIFWGNSDTDVIRILVERKKLGDMASCILDGRYLAQAQAARDAGIDVLILIAEGNMRSNPEDGMIDVPVWSIDPTTFKRKQVWVPLKPTISYSRFDQYLTELDYLAGIIVKRSRDVLETAAQIKALWLNFQTPPSKHGSLHQIFESVPLGPVLLTRPSLVRRMAKELNGIGWSRSAAVAQHFFSIRAMVDATEEEWMTIEGVGKGTAMKVVAALQGLRPGG